MPDTDITVDIITNPAIEINIVGGGTGGGGIPLAEVNVRPDDPTAGSVLLWFDTDAVAPPTGATGLTVDTNEPYKIIMLSDGTVKAIPVDADPPLPPLNLVPTVRLTSVTLVWDSAALATEYVVTRDGVDKATVTATTWRDTTVTLDQTYIYRVHSLDQYGQRSPASLPANATINSALNAAPVDVVITCWPVLLPTDGPAWLRVNGRDIDVQQLAYLLNVDNGSLRPTQDPSLYLLTL